MLEQVSALTSSSGNKHKLQEFIKLSENDNTVSEEFTAQTLLNIFPGDVQNTFCFLYLEEERTGKKTDIYPLHTETQGWQAMTQNKDEPLAIIIWRAGQACICLSFCMFVKVMQ